VDQKKPSDQDEEYVIYSTVLQRAFPDENLERIVLGDRTLMPLPPIIMGMTQFGNSKAMRQIRASVSKDTESDYEAKNKTQVELTNKFSCSVPIVLISAEELDRIFLTDSKPKKPKSDGLQNFNRQFPNSHGVSTISQIGFNHDRTQALVYIGNVCGGLCGSGQYFLLSKTGDAWTVLHSAVSWVS
jgi:hypothetical protein